MLIDFKVCLPPEKLSAVSTGNLAKLASNVRLPVDGEQVRVLTEFLQGRQEPHRLLRKEQSVKRNAVIILSPKLVNIVDGKPTISKSAVRLLEIAWIRSVIVGLIGVTGSAHQHAARLDGLIQESELGGEQLIDVVSTVARRLWYKLPPISTFGDKVRNTKQLDVVFVDKKRVFRDCLRLRHLVYNELGYLPDEIVHTNSQLEFDCYDCWAKHFAVVDRHNNNQVVGTMRLIAPSGQANPFPVGTSLPDAQYERWCHEFAGEEPSPIFTRILQHCRLSALPILDSFNYFNDLRDQVQYKPLLQPKYSCEISRVVSHPEYRGCGILKLLLKKAEEIAKQARKRYILLECAPFHETMYRKYGFEVIEDEGRRYYRRAQRLDSFAVAMLMDINANSKDARHLKFFRIPIERPDQLDFDIVITHPGLNELGISEPLNKPYLPRPNSVHHVNQTAKSSGTAFSTHVKIAFKELGPELTQILQELYRRLPEANLRLVSGSQELAMDPGTINFRPNNLLVRRIENWLEGLRVAV